MSREKIEGHNGHTIRFIDSVGAEHTGLVLRPSEYLDGVMVEAGGRFPAWVPLHRIKACSCNNLYSDDLPNVGD